MRGEAVIASLLAASSTVVALAGTRIARTRLPQNSNYPALVYELVSEVPVPPITALPPARLGSKCP